MVKAKPNTTQTILSPRKRFLFLAILVLVPSLLAFLAAELYVRHTRHYTDLWALTGRKIGGPINSWAFLDAFSAYTGRPGIYRIQTSKKTINRHGFISTPELTISKPKDTLRIVFLGESSTAGTGRDLADEDTWPWQVAELLRKRSTKKKIEFINAALGGYTTFESFGRFWSRVRFFSPDIVVVYHGWNEMYYFNEKVDEITSWRQGKLRVPVYEPHWFDYLIRPSQLLTKVRIRLSGYVAGEFGNTSSSEKVADTYDRRGLAIFRTNLRLLKGAASIFGAKLFVAKQATLIVPDLPEEERRRARYDYHGFGYEGHVDAFRQIYRIIDEEIAAENIIDVTPISGTPEYFYDHIHPTELGAQQIAKIVATALVPYISELDSKNTQNPVSR